MSKTELLAQLRDIHLPPPVSWWPLAPGWYLIFSLLCLGLLLMLWKSYQRYACNRPKREALDLLEKYYQDYQQRKDARRISAQVSELLRRVALVYYPRAEVAGLKGQAWINFLNATAQQVDFTAIDSMLLVLPFQPAQNSSLKPLFEQTKAWIKQRRKPCLS